LINLFYHRFVGVEKTVGLYSKECILYCLVKSWLVLFLW